LADEAVYCAACGLRVVQRCGLCESYSEEGLPFCGVCGAAFRGGSDLSNLLARAGKLEVLRRYLSRQVFDSLLERGTPLRDEKREVCVVFADISGFTTYSENHEPEEVLAMLNGCFLGMVEAVRRYDGTIDKFIGDCLMAVFGAPRAHENDCERALRCALDMLEAVAVYNRSLKTPVGLSIGVNAGPVIAGNVGAGEQLGYSVIGDAVNLAQRLQSAARTGQILVGPLLPVRCGDLFDLSAMAPIKVKGKQQPVPVFELRGVKSTLQVSTQTAGCFRDVPRPHFETQLLGALEASRAAVLVLAESGLGASHLVSRRGVPLLEERGGRVLRIELVDQHAGEPYAALDLVLEALFACAAEGEGLACDRCDEAHRVMLRSHGRDVPEVVAHLDREERASALVHLFRRAMLAVSAAGVTAVVLDSLQLLDDLSWRILKLLLEQPEDGGPVMILVGRPQQRWKQLEGIPRIELPPFTREETAHLLGPLLENVAEPEALLDLIQDRSQGNPRFAYELVKHLERSKLLQHFESGWFFDRERAQLQTPPTLVAILRSRVDALAPTERDLLASLAVLGATVDRCLLERVLPDREEATLAVLVEAGLLQVGDDRGLRFSSQLLRQTCYDANPGPERAHLHLRCAKALEEVRGSDTAAILTHYLETGERVAQLEYLQRRAEELHGAHDQDGRRTCLEQVLEIVGNSPPKEWTEQERGSVFCKALLGLAELSFLQQEHERVLTLAKQACNEARRLEHLEPFLDGLHFLGLALHARRERGAAETHLRKAMEVARRRGDQVRYLRGLQALGSVFQETDRGEEALALAGELVTATEQRVRASGHNMRGTVLLKLERGKEAEHDFRTALELSRASKEVILEGKALGNLAALLCREGKYAEAAGCAEQALALTRRTGDRLGEAKQTFNLAAITELRGSLREARQLFQASYELARAIRFREGSAMSAAALDRLPVG